MSEKLKNFLRCKIEEMKMKIKCLKVKKLTIQLIHSGLITISVGSAAILTIIAPLGVTVMIIALISGIAAISTSIIMRFELKKKHKKLSNMIGQLNILKDQLDYELECNYNLSDEQCKSLLKDYRECFYLK
jgi:hypothetical protein